MVLSALKLEAQCADTSGLQLAPLGDRQQALRSDLPSAVIPAAAGVAAGEPKS